MSKLTIVQIGVLFFVSLVALIESLILLLASLSFPQTRSAGSVLSPLMVSILGFTVVAAIVSLHARLSILEGRLVAAKSDDTTPPA